MEDTRAQGGAARGFIGEGEPTVETPGGVSEDAPREPGKSAEDCGSATRKRDE